MTQARHPNRGHALEVGAAYSRLCELRLQGRPAPWDAVTHELGLRRESETLPFRWQRAAELLARCPELTLTSIAADPAVDLKPDTVKKRRATAKLACGLGFEEYVAAWQSAQRSRLEALQAAEGVKAAEELYAIFSQGKRVLARLQANLLEYAENPPKSYAALGTHGYAEFPTQQLSVQTLIDFPGVEPSPPAPERRLLTLPFASRLLEEQERIFKAGQIAARLLVGLKPAGEGEGADDAPIMSAEEFSRRRAEIEATLDELRGYEREVA